MTHYIWANLKVKPCIINTIANNFVLEWSNTNDVTISDEFDILPTDKLKGQPITSGSSNE